VLHELLSPKHAAQRLGVSRETVYRLCAKGVLPRVGAPFDWIPGAAGRSLIQRSPGGDELASPLRPLVEFLDAFAAIADVQHLARKLLSALGIARLPP